MKRTRKTKKTSKYPVGINASVTHLVSLSGVFAVDIPARSDPKEYLETRSVFAPQHKKDRALRIKSIKTL